MIRKPRPIGNEIKNMSDARSHIVVNMKLYEGKDIMGEEFVKQYGATCATTLRLTKQVWGCKRTIICDSWFEGVKTAVALKEKGLHSIMIVKNHHKLCRYTLRSC